MTVPSVIFKQWTNFQIFYQQRCDLSYFEENLFQISWPAVYRQADPLRRPFFPDHIHQTSEADSTQLFSCHVKQMTTRKLTKKKVGQEEVLAYNYSLFQARLGPVLL